MDSIVCFSHTGLFGMARIEFYSTRDGGFVYQQVLVIIWEINNGILVLRILGYANHMWVCLKILYIHKYMYNVRHPSYKLVYKPQ